MLQTPSPDVEQRQQHQGDSAISVVTAQPGERLAQPPPEVDLAQIASEQLQAAIRRERLRHELDRQITLDHSSQARYAQPHQRGLQCEGSDVGAFSLKSTPGAPLIHFGRAFTPRLFADWG